MAGDTPVFYLGLNMAGAISAGAYTAGVVDFLIDALDTWYGERERQPASWDIPRHHVRLGVLSGASAGGMTAAIAAAALCEEFRPVRSVPPPGAMPANRLYRSWVADIDISDLLTDHDLRRERSGVVSILDSTVIDAIAAAALQVTNPRPARRAWVNEGLKVILTLTNLGGVPYAIETGSGSAETQTLYHADQQDFEVRWEPDGGSPAAVVLRPGEPAPWQMLAAAATATGAFPLMLAPRILHRSTTEYNQRRWRISLDQPDCAARPGRCDSFEPLRPNWNVADGVPFQTANVDGGATNNSPFECAHRELTLLDPPHPAGHNPRSAREADRAVISIAPFLSTPRFRIDAVPKVDLGSAAGQLIDTLLSQSRIQGENIKLTQDPQVFSRFAIAPSIDDTTVNALASAALGAFGGFLAREFRDHDYQLGRRNCQRFLERYFGLPLDNPVIAPYLPASAAARDRLLSQFGMDLSDGSRGMALIPLIGELRNEVRIDRMRINRSRLEPIADAAVERLKRVIARLIADSGWLPALGFRAVWLVASGELKRLFLTKVGYELARQDLIS